MSTVGTTPNVDNERYVRFAVHYHYDRAQRLYYKDAPSRIVLVDLQEVERYGGIDPIIKRILAIMDGCMAWEHYCRIDRLVHVGGGVNA